MSHAIEHPPNAFYGFIISFIFQCILCTSTFFISKDWKIFEIAQTLQWNCSKVFVQNVFLQPAGIFKLAVSLKWFNCWKVCFLQPCGIFNEIVQKYLYKTFFFAAVRYFPVWRSLSAATLDSSPEPYCRNLLASKGFLIIFPPPKLSKKCLKIM